MRRMVQERLVNQVARKLIAVAQCLHGVYVWTVDANCLMATYSNRRKILSNISFGRNILSFVA